MKTVSCTVTGSAPDVSWRREQTREGSTRQGSRAAGRQPGAVPLAVTSDAPANTQPTWALMVSGYADSSPLTEPRLGVTAFEHPTDPANSRLNIVEKQ